MSQENKYSQVDRRRDLSLAEFRSEYLYPARPVVIAGAIEDWPARTTWTWEYFKQHCGDAQVRVFRYDGTKEFTPDDFLYKTLREFIDEAVSGEWPGYPYYLRDDWRLFVDYPELLDDYQIPEYFFDWFKLLPPFLRLPYPRIFIGPKGATTPLHVDIWGTHAWLSQLIGRKRWLLWPPDQLSMLYDCQVKVEDPDLNRFPRYSEAEPLECMMEPGDTIFVPGGWPHWVVSLDATLSISHNFMASGCFGTSLVHAIHQLGIQRVKRKLGFGAEA